MNYSEYTFCNVMGLKDGDNTCGYGLHFNYNIIQHLWQVLNFNFFIDRFIKKLNFYIIFYLYKWLIKHFFFEHVVSELSV